MGRSDPVLSYLPTIIVKAQTPMTIDCQRRVFVIRLAGAGLTVCALPGRSAGEPKLKESEPEAKQHAYVENAVKVDVKNFPDFKDTQKCGSCQLYEDREKSWGTCALFPGKLVSEPGWCDVWG